ncbi:MAG: FliM/FliN family flagellar motor switch protein [Halopseudomonas aestusnigri]
MSVNVKFKPLSRPAAESSRRIWRQRKSIKIWDGSAALSLRLDHGAQPNAPVHIRLKAKDYIFGLEIESEILDDLFEKKSNESARDVFSDDVLLQAEIALKDIFELTEEACGTSIELVELSQELIEESVTLSGWIRFKNDCAFRINLPDNLIDIACDLISAWPETKVPLYFPVTCPLIISDLYISPRLLAELQVGDFIPLRNCHWAEPLVKIKLPCGPPVQGSISGDQLTIHEVSGAFAMQDNTEQFSNSENETNENFTSEGDEEGLPEENLVKEAQHSNVSVEMGEINIPINELEHIAPGYVLDLDFPIDGIVTVTTNGQPFAKGVLVDVAGTVGVQINELMLNA